MHVRETEVERCKPAHYPVHSRFGRVTPVTGSRKASHEFLRAAAAVEAGPGRRIPVFGNHSSTSTASQSSPISQHLVAINEVWVVVNIRPERRGSRETVSISLAALLPDVVTHKVGPSPSLAIMCIWAM